MVVTVLVHLLLAQAPPEYMKRRSALVEAECANSVGGGIRLTDQEQAVDKLLRAARADTPSALASQSFFRTASTIRQSTLFQMLQPLPKASALHLHFDSLLESRWFVNVTYEEHCLACWPAGSGGPVAFRFAADSGRGLPGCASGWQRVSDLRRMSSDVPAFDEQIYRSLSLCTADGAPFPSVDAAWNKFNAAFPMLAGLLMYEPVFRKYVGAALDTFVDDGLQRVELRAGLSGNVTYTLDQSGLPASHAVSLWTHAAAARNLSLGFIFSSYRGLSPEAIAHELADARSLAAHSPPGTIIGFDLVGQEDAGRPLLEFAPVLLRQPEPRLPYVFHAGETLGNGNATDQNVLDALLLGSRRIGHGYSVRSHPTLRGTAKTQGVALEVNLISNQVLGLVDDLHNHPLALFLADDLPVVLSSDDPGLWGAAGVTYDWVLALLVSSEACGGLAMLKQLARNSIDHALLAEVEKAALLAAWTSRWERYIDEFLAAWQAEPHGRH
jgi:adenosine deaminase-related growth factor